MKAIGVIPTRYASIRFPGNSLKKILRKPLLQWVIEGARQSKLLSEIWGANLGQRGIVSKLADIAL